MPRAGVGSWSSFRADKVQEKLQVHPCQVAHACSIVPESGLECSSSDEDVISLSRRESCADFAELSLELLELSEWTLAAYGGFFREENITVLEAHVPSCMLFDMQVNPYPPGRFLVLSDNLALVLALCRRRSIFHIAFGHASNLCI